LKIYRADTHIKCYDFQTPTQNPEVSPSDSLYLSGHLHKNTPGSRDTAEKMAARDDKRQQP